MDLESNSQSELDLALVLLSRGYFTEPGRAEAAVGIAEMRRVGEVERLEPELRRNPLGDWEALERREVEVRETGAAQNVAAGCPVSGGCRCGKLRRIKPQLTSADVAK